MAKKYFTQYDHPKTKPVKCDERYITRQLKFLDDEGNPYLETVETINMWEKTQSHIEECKIENILKAAALGDLQALNQRDATYIDATDFPNTLAAFENVRIRAIDEFKHMPYEVRKEFDNNPDKYFSMMGTKEFADIMEPYNKKIADIKEAGSIAEYNKKVAETAKFNLDVKAAEGSKTE